MAQAKAVRNAGDAAATATNACGSISRRESLNRQRRRPVCQAPLPSPPLLKSRRHRKRATMGPAARIVITLFTNAC
jgi:hypothetical protein